jgi:MFS family permease
MVECIDTLRKFVLTITAVTGLIIGALFVSYATWPWVFYFMSIVGFFLAIGVAILSPSPQRPPATIAEKALRFRRLDLVGVSILTGEWAFLHSMGI